MTKTILTKRQLNFSSLKRSPNMRTNINDEVFNIVYKLKEMNLKETLERPMSPADANEHGKICFKYAMESILNVLKNFEKELSVGSATSLTVGRNLGLLYSTMPVSYTHLDVYKRQDKTLDICQG